MNTLESDKGAAIDPSAAVNEEKAAAFSSIKLMSAMCEGLKSGMCERDMINVTLNMLLVYADVKPTIRTYDDLFLPVTSDELQTVLDFTGKVELQKALQLEEAWKRMVEAKRKEDYKQTMDREFGR